MKQDVYTKNLTKIVEACDELGWLVGLDNVKSMYKYTEGDAEYNNVGLIIGTRSFINTYFPEIIIDPEIKDFIRHRHNVYL